MFDREIKRIEKLIEEREEYENTFFAMEPDDYFSKFTIAQYNPNYVIVKDACGFEEEMVEPFDDCLLQLRDDNLIKERIVSEIVYFNDFEGIPIEMDLMDHQIEAYLKPDFDFEWDFSMFDNNPFDHHYVEESEFRKSRCCLCGMDYMPHDDFYISSDCYDYPDGDLLGIYPL